LFIDSSHTVKFGSDVCYEFLEILPTLKRGVWVHVHDIFFPHDYPAEWLLKRRLALNEQYLLEAFLSFNREFQVALANYWLSLDYPDSLINWLAKTVSPAAAQRRNGKPGCHVAPLRRCVSNPPASFWMMRVK